MLSPLGLILTSARSIDHLEAAARGFSLLKIVPAWGLSWTPDAIRRTVSLCPTLIVRTSWGDPSAYEGQRPYPEPDRILEELRPWYAARQDIIIEMGNEPVVPGHAHLDPGRYARALEATVRMCRDVFPRAKLLPPAHCVDQAVSDAVIGLWLQACAPAYRLCDALTIHAYSLEQKRRALSLLRTHVGAAPVWLTECNLDADLAPEARAAAIRELAHGTEGACVFHLDQLGAPTAWPRYRLGDAELAALRGPVEPVPALGGRVDGFAMDVRRWPTVAAFRAHLARYRYAETAPWARGAVVHHTWKPTAVDWRGAASVEGLARFYRTQKTPPWSAGPHLFIAAGSPNAAHDGIWQMTPLNQPGIHAGAANSHLWGVEHVGDFSTRPMSADTVALGAGAIAALLDWAGLPTSAATVSPHSQWGKPECPGGAVDMPAYRRAVAALRQAGG